ncbi:MAG: VTT domain-containing protein [Anaerolineae bacterium]
MQRSESPAEARSEGVRRLGALGAAVAITVILVLFRDEVIGLVVALREQGQDQPIWGHLVVFVINLVGSGTVILPVPALIAVYLGGSILHPVTVGIVAGAASALGEMTGYLAGYGGQGLVEDHQVYRRMSGWMRRNGFLTILVLSIIPNPVFDVAGMAAGALRFPIWQFLSSALIGKTLKMTAVAFGGYYSIALVERLVEGG